MPIPNHILAFDFSHSPQTVALNQGNGIGCVEIPTGQRTDEAFPEALTQLGEPGWFQGIEAYLTTDGPGSFTGLRVAYAAIKALAQVRPLPLFTVQGHEILAMEWITTRAPKAADQCEAITRVSSRRYLVTVFSVHPLAGLEEKVFEETELNELSLKNPISREALPLRFSTEVVPYNAETLCRHWQNAKTLQKLEGLTAIASASPHYYGSERFNP